MQQPNYTDLQYVNGALLNSGQAYIAASLKDLGYRLFSGGFINFNELTITPSNLTIAVVAGSNFRLLDGNGNLAGFYGTTNGATTDTLTIDFSSFVPSSGSQLVYLLASKLAITENPVAVIGPPIGHPDYNPANAPFTWNFETLDSIQLVASTTAPDNVTTFEVLRTTLVAGQTSITSYSTANARYAQPNQSVIVYAGNPNGNLAGVQGGNGVTPSIVWDTSDNLFWVCTTTGSDSTAVWTGAANLQGNSSYTFDVANAVPGTQNAIPITQADTRYASISAFTRMSSYTSAGTYTFTVPAGVTKIKAIVTGGGGGGAGCTPAGGNNYQSAAGGGAGGTAIGVYTVTPGTNITITVGAAGTAGAAANGNGGTGGTSSFGAFATAAGGTGGAWATNVVSAGGGGGIASGGSINTQGGEGGDGQSGSFIKDGHGGASWWGGGGRAGSSGGVAGTAYGSGGGGNYQLAGAGGAGQVGAVVLEY